MCPCTTLLWLAGRLGICSDESQPEGYVLHTELVDSLTRLLSQPVVAAALGIALGAGLLLASRASFRTLDSADPSRALVLAAAALLGRLVAATLVIYLYSRFVPAGFPAFGVSLAGTFIVLYTVELVRYAGLHRYARPAAGSRDGR